MDNSSCTFLTSTDNSSTRSRVIRLVGPEILNAYFTCLLYTSDAADEEDSVVLGGRRLIKKKKKREKER